jgi:hypothetical protein
MMRRTTVRAVAWPIIIGTVALALQDVFARSQRDNADVNIGAALAVALVQLVLFLVAGFLAPRVVDGRPVIGFLCVTRLGAFPGGHRRGDMVERVEPPGLGGSSNVS